MNGAKINLKESIIKTLAYSDIFDYPLAENEIRKFLIECSAKKITLKKELKNISVISKKNKFYCFKNRTEIINKRMDREKESLLKFKFAKKIIFKLSLIPTVQLIGISGALSMNNCEKDDDIDLFIITSKKTLWTTRLFLIFLLEIMGKRRKRLEEDTKDKICLNFLIDESSIGFIKKRQDLYTAHEIIQLIPIFERNNMYKKFINSNYWIKNFLPNFEFKRKIKHDNKSFINSLLFYILYFIMRFPSFEWFAKIIQFQFMKKHITKEIISNNFLAFHPNDQRKKTLDLFNKKLKIYLNTN
ncbi:hypothetical protein C4559_05605 [Candidatus Microgenomates bacterium]|nr:MAG: hypothetical protein C4559_05605 [Candidatus Microgenomates bacterium]